MRKGADARAAAAVAGSDLGVPNQDELLGALCSCCAPTALLLRTTHCAYHACCAVGFAALLLRRARHAAMLAVLLRRWLGMLH